MSTTATIEQIRAHFTMATRFESDHRMSKKFGDTFDSWFKPYATAAAAIKRIRKLVDEHDECVHIDCTMRDDILAALDGIK